MALLDRRLFAHARLLGFVAVGTVLPSLPACSGDDKSGIMLAVSTDMLAPKDVNAVGVTVFTDDKIKFNVVGRVTPEGEVLLPATLAIAEPDDPNATIRIRVVAFQERKARVMRDVRTSIPKGGRIALLRIPLNFANDGSVNGELAEGILPAPSTTKSLGKSTLLPRDFGTSDGYDPSLFVPNCANPTETWVAGQCVDAYVPWTSLPTFTAESVGRADDAATCFDTYGCFAGSTDIPETGDTDVTLDRASCSLLLHGADPTKLNVALVTATTGACIQSGSCYVPLDHGAAGWTESDGRVQLPAYACKLTPTTASLVLAPSTAPASCGAKTESRAACTVTGDAGTGTAATALVSAEDFASSIAVDTIAGTLYTAGSTRIARLALATGAPTELARTAGKKPWKFGPATTGALLTDGTAVGQILSETATATPVSLPGNGTDTTDGAFGRLWAAGGLAFSGFGATANPVANTQVIGPTALSHVGGRFIAGTSSGEAWSCAVTNLVGTLDCYGSAPVSAQKPIDAIAEDLTSGALGAWALASDGIYYLRTDTTARTLTSTAVFPATFDAVDDGGIRLRRAIVGAGHCVIYSSAIGAEWLVSDGGGKAHGGVIARGSDTKPILGVAVDAASVYYSVYAAANDGGGIFRAAIPAECKTH